MNKSKNYDRCSVLFLKQQQQQQKISANVKQEKNLIK